MNILSADDILKMSKKKKRPIKAKKDIIGFDVMGGAESFPVTKDSTEILEMVSTTWSAGAPFRRQTERSDRYYKGEQWKDKVVIRHRDGTKEVLTEEEYIERQGKPALKQNLIRPLVVNGRRTKGCRHDDSRSRRSSQNERQERKGCTTL